MVLASKYGIAPAPVTPQMFGAAGKEHMEKYGEWVWLSQSHCKHASVVEGEGFEGRES